MSFNRNALAVLTLFFSLILSACGGGGSGTIEIEPIEEDISITVNNLADGETVTETLNMQVTVSGPTSLLSSIASVEYWLDGTKKTSADISNKFSDFNLQIPLGCSACNDESNHTFEIKLFDGDNELLASISQDFTYDIADAEDGDDDGANDGSADGSSDGSADGSADGNNDGSADGNDDGSADGNDDGSADGNDDGSSDGSADGSADGNDDGSADGSDDGDSDDTTKPVITTFNINQASPVDEGTLVTLTAEVSDNEAVASVTVYNSSTKICDMDLLSGTSKIGTYQCNWDTLYSPGTFSMRVKATDSAGNTEESSTKSFVVNESTFTPPPKVDFQQVADFGDNPGDLKMFLYVPDGLTRNAPVVMALHGCNQNGKPITTTAGNPVAHATGHALGFKMDSGWTELADEYKFIVIFPEQTVRVTNPNDTNKVNNDFACFNWAGFYGYNIGRDQGESASLIDMLEYVQSNYSTDLDGIFITGLSAGAGMTTAMLTHYPDIFNAGAPMAGVTFGCAHYDGLKGDDLQDRAFDCMGVTKEFQKKNLGQADEMMPEDLKHSPEEWAEMVNTFSPDNYTGSFPRIIIWQGSNDQYVDPDHLEESVKQWTEVHETTQTPSVTGKLKPSNSNHIYNEYIDSEGNIKVASVKVTGMLHGIAVDPGISTDQGGTCTSGANRVNSTCPSNLTVAGMDVPWAHDWDIYSSYYTAQWWGLLDRSYPRRDEQSQPISLKISSPSGGDIVGTGSNIVTITASAAHTSGINRVEFSIDNEIICTTNSSPYSCDWNTTGYAETTKYNIKAEAFSNEGKSKTSSIYVWLKQQKAECVTATNYEHIQANRAENCTINYIPSACAVGSGDNLGQPGVEAWSPSTSLEQTTSGYWEIVDSCD